MRVTNNMLVANMLRNINNNTRRLDKRQNQFATGKVIRYASDDPMIAYKSLKLKTDLSKLEQYEKNVDDALSWLEITESAVADIGDVLQRARELTVQAANGALTVEEREKIASEMKQLKEQIISSGNTTYTGRYIFSGYKTDEKLFTDTGKYNIDITKDIFNNKPTSIYEVGVGEDIQVSTNGLDIFGYEEIDIAKCIKAGEDTNNPAIVGPGDNFTDAEIANGDFDNLKIIVTYNGERREIELGSGIADKADLEARLQTKLNVEFGAGNVQPVINDLGGGTYNIEFQAPGAGPQTLKVDVVKVKESSLIKDFEKAITALENDDSSGIDNFLGEIDVHMNRILAVRGDIGARVNRMELIHERIEEDNLSFTTLLSKNEDADMAEVIMKLKVEENIYRASLSAGARVIQPTLLDFLR